MRVKPALLMLSISLPMTTIPFFVFQLKKKTIKFPETLKAKIIIFIARAYLPLLCCMLIFLISASRLSFTKIFINSHGCNIKNAFQLYGRT